MVLYYIVVTQCTGISVLVAEALGAWQIRRCGMRELAPRWYLSDDQSSRLCRRCYQNPYIHLFPKLVWAGQRNKPEPLQ